MEKKNRETQRDDNFEISLFFAMPQNPSYVHVYKSYYRMYISCDISFANFPSAKHVYVIRIRTVCRGQPATTTDSPRVSTEKKKITHETYTLRDRSYGRHSHCKNRKHKTVDRK